MRDDTQADRTVRAAAERARHGGDYPAVPTTLRRGTLPERTSPPERGFPLWLIIALAALAVPRVLVHDLRLAPPDGWVNALLVFVPPLIWIAVVLWQRPPRPFLTIVLIGIGYAVMLAIGHQVMWDASFGDNPPRIGGNLEGRLDPLVEGLVLRAFAFVSSLVTGTLVGVIIGLVGAGLARLQRVLTRRYA